MDESCHICGSETTDGMCCEMCGGFVCCYHFDLDKTEDYPKVCCLNCYNPPPLNMEEIFFPISRISTHKQKTEPLMHISWLSLGF
jgi:hypothetical protein